MGGYSKQVVAVQCCLFMFIRVPRCFAEIGQTNSPRTGWGRQLMAPQAPFTSQPDQPDPVRKLSWMSQQPTRPALQHGPRRSEWPSERPVVVAKLEILFGDRT